PIINPQSLRSIDKNLEKHSLAFILSSPDDPRPLRLPHRRPCLLLPEMPLRCPLRCAPPPLRTIGNHCSVASLLNSFREMCYCQPNAFASVLLLRPPWPLAFSALSSRWALSVFTPPLSRVLDGLVSISSINCRFGVDISALGELWVTDQIVDYFFFSKSNL
ncbi:unnamed protein product, partial [Linum tenue]